MRITVTTKGLMRQRRKAYEYCTRIVMIVVGRVANTKILDKLDGGVLCKASALHPRRSLVENAPLPDPLAPASLGVTRPKPLGGLVVNLV